MEPGSSTIAIDDQAALEAADIRVRFRSVAVSERIRLVMVEAEGRGPIHLENRFDNRDAHVGFNFCVKGTTDFALSGGYPTAHAREGTINNFVMPRCATTQGIHGSDRIALVTAYIELKAFLKLIGEQGEELPLKLRDSLDAMDRCYFENHRWQPVVQAILSQVFHAQLSPLAQRIFLESKVLELIAVILDLFTRQSEREPKLSRRDVERIQYAKELLLRDIADPPSLARLAREAGTNEFTLKRGFKQLFDVPVFKYLQHVRLAKAYELFQATDLQVAEVAQTVGYESTSSFIRAFTMHFGMRPTEVKRIPFRTI